jgi:hypothetical protein
MQRKTEEELADIINRASESVAASNGKESQAEDEEEEEMVNVRPSFNVIRQSLIHIDLHRRSLIKKRGRGTGRGERSRRGLGIGR